MSNADETLYRVKDMLRWGDYKSVFTVNGYNVNDDIKFLLDELSGYEYIEDEIKEKDETIYELEKSCAKKDVEIEKLVHLFIETQCDWPNSDSGPSWFEKLIQEYDIELEN